MTQKEKYDYDVKSFYYVTLIDLVSGVSFQEIYDQLREFEMLENYEACDGIAKAIKFSQDKSILSIYGGDRDWETPLTKSIRVT